MKVIMSGTLILEEVSVNSNQVRININIRIN